MPFVTCPFCGRNYKGKQIQISDDEFILVTRKHYQYIPNTNNLGICITKGKKIICPGSGKREKKP